MDGQRFAEPLLTAAQAAMHLAIPRTTIGEWAAAGLLHSVASTGRFQPTMPLVAVAEAQVLHGLRGWGLHGLEIRRAVRRLSAEFGPFALLSQRLATDGVALLRDLSRPEAQHLGTPRWERVVDGQAVLPIIVDDHVRYFEWEPDGSPKRLTLRSYARHGAEVVLDPRYGYGQPVFVRTKVRVLDIMRLLLAGETKEDIAYDYELSLAEVNAAVRVLGAERAAA
ncbi:MAG TPA: DUF433 domain-containing protein [Pseudonocardiaceae bacterium]